MDGFMRKDEQIKIQYATKYANIENSYKKWKGEVLGLTRTDAVSKRKHTKQNFKKEYWQILNGKQNMQTHSRI
jgi:hypothetical protein